MGMIAEEEPKRWEGLSCSDSEFVGRDAGDVGGVVGRRGKEGWTFQTFEKQKSDLWIST